MMASQITPTGMVAYSATNPLDQIPVGPQVFPFGAPTVDQSQVEPYQASVYSPGIKSSQMQIPDSTYQSVGDASNYMTQVQAVDSLPAANYDASALAPQYQMAEAQPAAEAVYDAGAYQTGVQYAEGYNTGYQYRTVLKPVVKTEYQTVVKYKPVTKTTLVPKVTTKYVPVAKTVANPAASTIGNLPQQSLALSQANPLAGSALQGSALSPQTMAMPTVGADPHFVHNYPIYENDPRRKAGII